MDADIDADTARMRERMAALFIYKPPDVTLTQHLRGLAVSISSQIDTLHSNAAVARQQISALRAGSELSPDVADAAATALADCIDRAEEAKASKLEGEAVTVDEALSEADTLYVAASSAAADHSTSRLDVARVAARLSRLQARIRVLPTAPVEPIVFSVEPGPCEPTSRANELGRVSAPRAVTPADVAIVGAPSFVLPGGTLNFSLELLPDAYPCESEFDAAVALGMLAAHARWEVALLPPAAAATAEGDVASAAPEAGTPLVALFEQDEAGRRIKVAVAVPASALLDSSVAFEPMSVGGVGAAEEEDTSTLRVRVGACHDVVPEGLLMQAAAAGDAVAVRAQLALGASTEERSAHGGWSPLLTAIKSSSSRHWGAASHGAAGEAAAHVLIDAGASLAVVAENGLTPLFAAIEHGMLQLAIRIVSLGAPLNAPGPDGRTPLLLAVQGGHIAVSLALLTAGADASAPQAHTGTAPLHAAAAGKGFGEVVAALLAAGADVNAADASGTTPLIAAAASGFGADAVAALLAAGANPGAADRHGSTALHVVAEPRRSEIVKALLSRGANVSAVDSAGKSPLLVAAQAGRCDAALLLLTLGADARQADLSGSTALHAAARHGDMRLVKALLALQGARAPDAGRVDSEGHSPADRAHAAGHPRIASLIEAAAAEQEDEDEDA